MKRTCRKCRVDKDESEFYPSRVRLTSGNLRIRKECKECDRAYNNQRRRINETSKACPLCETSRISKYAKKCMKCHHKSLRGSGSPVWKGGRHISPDGYVVINFPKWTGAARRCDLEHRIVMAKMIGRPLLSFENVHHKNGVRHDNRPENLELWTKPQPSSIRVEDAVAWAKEVLAMYEPSALSERTEARA